MPKLPSQCGAALPVQVFTTIDGTLKTSDISGGDGCDDIYPPGVAFPGAAQFLLELARGSKAASQVLTPTPFSDKSGPPSVLSDEDQLLVDFQDLDVEQGQQVSGFNYQDGGIEKLKAGEPGNGKFHLNVDGTMIPPDQRGLEGACGRGKANYINFVKYFSSAEVAAGPDAPASRASATDSCVVFVGNDASGACMPGAASMSSYVKKGTDELGLKAAFIRHLAQAKNTCKKDQELLPCHELKASSERAPIFLFGNYLEAARKALDNSFISQAGFGRVRNAVSQFHGSNCDGDKSTNQKMASDAACAHLNLSLKANGVAEPGQSKPPDLEPSKDPTAGGHAGDHEHGKVGGNDKYDEVGNEEGKQEEAIDDNNAEQGGGDDEGAGDGTEDGLAQPGGPQ